MTDGEAIWVCAGCRSVNKLRAKQCYNCRTPKDRAAVDPSNVDVTTSGQIREIALPDFEPSRPYAVVASILILVIGTVHAINSLVGVTFIIRVADGDLLSDAEIINFGLVGLATFGIALIALTGWAFWLSKAVRTMPALGLGYPAANGLMAFVENFVPVLNLWRVPAIVRDIVVRLDPGESRGGTLISAAWVGLITGYLLPRFGGFVNQLGAETFETYVRNLVIIQLLSLALVLTGSILLVVLIWWIEARISRRQAALTKAEPEAASGLVAAPGGVAWAVGGSATAFKPPAPATAPATAIATSVPGPLGSVAATDPDQSFSRPITALTGTHPPSDTAPVGFAAVGAQAAKPRLTGEPTLTPGPAPDPVVGPRLELTIAHDGSMVATLDGESEPITIKGLRDAAKVLARVHGSAVVVVVDGTAQATSMAGQAVQIFGDAGVRAAMGQRPG